VRSRILLGVSAWLVGAGAATGVSLLAVNALGQGMTPAAGQQLSVLAVNRALASEGVEQRATPPRWAPPLAPSIGRASSPVIRRAPSPSPAAPGGTVLTSQGGTVIATCAGARAYLVSWSPGQGFEPAHVIRGPAASARVTFISTQLTVIMAVSCAAGVPTATSSVTGSLSGDE
jgi:hypothetical protein